MKIQVHIMRVLERAIEDSMRRFASCTAQTQPRDYALRRGKPQPRPTRAREEGADQAASSRLIRSNSSRVSSPLA